jgi:N-acetylglucosaminyl-diphospho-decaprenol L-rhamnosyltransferase
MPCKKELNYLLEKHKQYSTLLQCTTRIMTYVSIILVNYNGLNFLNECLTSIEQFVNNVNSEVIVVDNFSADGSAKSIKDNFSSIILICSDSNLGFSKANNLAVKHSHGEHLLFLNTDTILTENTPQILSDYLIQAKDVGMVSPRIIFRDGSYQLSCGKLPNLATEFLDKIRYGLDRKWHHIFGNLYNKQYSSIQEVGWLTGACLMIRRDVFEQIGGFDESFFMYFEDKDICKRVREAGWKVVYYPKTSLIHLLGGSSEGVKKSVNTYYRDSQLYYYQKHLGKFQTAILKFYLRLSGKV